MEIDLFFVGGYVRDKILGIESKDIDIVLVPKDDVNKEFELAIEKFIKEGYELVFKSQFFTAKLKKDDYIIDLAVSRKESYEYNGALPKIEIVYSIYEDLKRRDFTINAIAMDFSGKIIDIFNGIEHLKKRILVPINSLLDDPTRIFRGIRYAKKLNLKYSKKFLNQISSSKKFLRNVSFSRIKKELEIISSEKNRIFMWQDILKFKLFPNLEWNNIIYSFEEKIPLSYNSWILFYIAFLKYPIKLEHITKLEREIIELFKMKKLKRNLKSEIYEIAIAILRQRGMI
jgi:poly(A) polymerase/tRNA nucleotidyltransferase (CCA-adding enzyme)